MPMILSGLLTLRRRFLRQVQNEREHGEGSINYVENVEEALQGANVCFIFTEWGEIKAVKSEDYQRLMRTPLVYDGRNIYGVEDMKKSGVEYYFIGRKQSVTR